ncbi:MAG: hypothetical protein AAFZ18_16605 [Myxococcota bacterium]
MHRFLLTPLLAALLASASPAAAQESTEARFDALVQTALGQYREGDYLNAVDTFEAAYALDDRPELVYNVARSYEKALRPDEAIATYERFLKLPGTTAELRAKALDALAALREERNARARAEAAELPPTASAPANAPRAPPTTVAQAREPRNRALEWTLLGSGMVLAGAGAAFGVLALNSESDWKDARAAGAADARVNELIDETERNALLADILIGAGAATAVTGLILFLVRGDEVPAVSVSPSSTPDGGGGLVVTGRF